MKMYCIFMAEIAMLCKDFLGRAHNDFGFSYKNV